MRLRVIVVSSVLTFLTIALNDAASRAADPIAAGKPSPLVNSLWLIHRYGMPQAIRPEQDASVKTELVRVLAKEKALTAMGVVNLMDPNTFTRLAGEDGRMDAAEVERALAADVPASRKMLFPQVQAHCRLLSTGLDP